VTVWLPFAGTWTIGGDHFAKAGLGPGSGTCDPYTVVYDSASQLQRGRIGALTNTAVVARVKRNMRWLAFALLGCVVQPVAPLTLCDAMQ
jgi:hypothetical protein